MKVIIKLIFITGLSISLISAASPIVSASNKAINTSQNIVAGYSALKLFLEDEQYLTVIRRTKMLITFSGISEKSVALIDNIANTSEQSLTELEKLSGLKPSFAFKEFSDDVIAKATLDALRMTTAKEFLFQSENFEKNLLLSQLKVLQVISHLAEQLANQENNKQRKIWLTKLAKKYETYYQQINDNILITGVAS
jgi:hypothetical protein